MSKLTHFNEVGEAEMVDVSQKPVTVRTAIATGCITMQEQTLRLIEQGGHKKGDVIGIARVAGIMAAKKTAELIPLCHDYPDKTPPNRWQKVPRMRAISPPHFR